VGVKASEIDGVMIPQSAATTPLADVVDVHEPRRPQHAVAYIERTVNYLADLGVRADDQTQDLIQTSLHYSGQGENVPREVTKQIEVGFMRAYSGYLTETYGIQQPTVGDMLGHVLNAHPDRQRGVYGHTPEIKEAIYAQNAVISRVAPRSDEEGGEWEESGLIDDLPEYDVLEAVLEPGDEPVVGEPELPHLDVQPAEKIIDSRIHAWHGLRGYDFAGLESILNTGIKPTQQLEEFAVCMAASPALAADLNRETPAMANFVLGGSLSVGARVQDQGEKFIKSYGDEVDFRDEIRVPEVRRADIDSIMLPQDALDCPLEEATTHCERRRPEPHIAYIERTMHHLEALGALTEGELTAQAQRVIELTKTQFSTPGFDRNAYHAQNDLLEQSFMRAYAGCLREKYGIQNPTVGDMLRVVLSRVDTGGLQVYGHNATVREEMLRENARLHPARPWDMSSSEELFAKYHPYEYGPEEFIDS